MPITGSSYIIQQALKILKPLGYKATVFQSRARMPAALNGLPDLYLLREGVSYWIEVKARYGNSMRDQMSDSQWLWFHERKDDFNFFLRYAIVGSTEELVEWVESKVVWEEPHMDAYHKKYYALWLEKRSK